MAPDPTPQPKAVSWAVKAFVAFHLFCITVWSLPVPPPPLLQGRVRPVGTDPLLIWNQKNLKTIPPVNVYLSVTGFWQYWDMFAPNPAQTDLWVDAEITFKDGTQRHYAYPRIASLSIPDKFPNERYRKFYERVNMDANSYLWPQFALRIAHLNDNPANPPVTVELTRHWMEIVHPGRPQRADYESKLYFRYAVDQRKLAAMRTGP